MSWHVGLPVSGAGFATLGSVFCRFGIADRISPGTVVSAQLVQCVSPRIRGPAVLGGVVPPAGQRERVEVSLNGQDYTTGGPWFVAYDQGLVHVSGLVPHVCQIQVSEPKILNGRSIFDNKVLCRFGNGPFRCQNLLIIRVMLVRPS